MITRRCPFLLPSLPKALPRPSTRFITTSAPAPSPQNPPVATSTSAAQPFSTPFTPSPSTASPTNKTSTTKAPPKPKSSTPAGTPLRGLSYIKNAPPLIALEDDEYPDWLWTCLTPKTSSTSSATSTSSTADGSAEAGMGDPFGSKKQRRLARKMNAGKLGKGEDGAGEGEGAGGGGGAGGRVGIEEQSVDLAYGEVGTTEGDEAARQREELKVALRRKRRTGIREANFLRSMR